MPTDKQTDFYEAKSAEIKPANEGKDFDHLTLFDYTGIVREKSSISATVTSFLFAKTNFPVADNYL